MSYRTGLGYTLKQIIYDINFLKSQDALIETAGVQPFFVFVEEIITVSDTSITTSSGPTQFRIGTARVGYSQISI